MIISKNYLSIFTFRVSLFGLLTNINLRRVLSVSRVDVEFFYLIDFENFRHLFVWETKRFEHFIYERH